MSFGSFLRGLATLGLLLSLGLVSACSNDDDGGSVTPPVRELNSGLLGNGEVYPHTFNNIGTFPYHCEVHTGMKDTIRVEASSPNATLAVTISGNAFVSASSTVQPGGTVTWTNNDGVNHTVTSD